MFELLKIKLFGHQPAAKVSDKLLATLIQREFTSSAAIVRAKLDNIDSDNKTGKNRIAAGILKLADKNFDLLDDLIEKANNDSRDIFMWAEYPRCSEVGFDEVDKKQMKRIYREDFINFSNWLKG